MDQVTLSPVPASVGARIRWARKRKGLSLDALARAASTSRQHLIRLERDDHVPTDDMIARIAPALDQDAGFFHDAIAEAGDRRALADKLDGLYHALVALAREAVAQAAAERGGEEPT